MFFSVNDVMFRNGPTPKIRGAGADLAEIVRSKERRVKSLPFRFFVYFTVSPSTRTVGWAADLSQEAGLPLPSSRFRPLGT